MVCLVSASPIEIHFMQAQFGIFQHLNTFKLIKCWSSKYLEEKNLLEYYWHTAYSMYRNIVKNVCAFVYVQMHLRRHFPAKQNRKRMEHHLGSGWRWKRERNKREREMRFGSEKERKTTSEKRRDRDRQIQRGIQTTHRKSVFVAYNRRVEI